MRIWDLPPETLCNKHLLGEHAESHAIWSVLTRNLKGYSRHPEVLRWNGTLKALNRRHQDIAAEMERRGFVHKSPLDARLASGSGTQDRYIDSEDEQKKLLKRKGCSCSLTL